MVTVNQINLIKYNFCFNLIGSPRPVPANTKPIPETLNAEYVRDKQDGLDTPIPKNYFPDDNQL